MRVFFGALPADVLSFTSNTIRVRTPRNDDVPLQVMRSMTID